MSPIDLTCTRCGGEAGLRHTLVRLEYQTPCDAPIHAAAQRVVEAAVAEDTYNPPAEEFDDGHYDGLRMATHEAVAALLAAREEDESAD